MWQSPHMLILDEPTNYLDREALGALSEAIKDFGGGVVIITHNREFADAVCPEKWAVAAGKLTATGQPAALLEAAKLEWKAQEETVDALGEFFNLFFLSSGAAAERRSLSPISLSHTKKPS